MCMSSYLPELLTRVLPTHSLEDLRAAGMLVYKCVHLVYVAVDDDVQPVLDRVVLGDLLCGEGFGHVGGACGA